MSDLLLIPKPVLIVFILACLAGATLLIRAAFHHPRPAGYTAWCNNCRSATPHTEPKPWGNEGQVVTCLSCRSTRLIPAGEV
ncbi:MAG: hypothetical protein L0332_34500 [Chloroflexi bacterium]|nr:hypothetical protein [Chloroflexota bacterium]